MSDPTPSANSRSVPWRTWQEWQQVAAVVLGVSPSAFILPEKISLPDHVLALMDVWELRGRVPTIISVTKQLLRIISGPVTACDRSPLLAVALLRLLNALVAPYHGATAASTSRVATMLGLSPILVELRHAAAHQAQMPSWEQLSLGAAAAWLWLLDHYWRPQWRAITPTQPSSEQLVSLLSTYRKAAVADLLTKGDSYSQKKLACDAIKLHFEAFSGHSTEAEKNDQVEGIEAQIDVIVGELLRPPKCVHLMSVFLKQSSLVHFFYDNFCKGKLEFASFRDDGGKFGGFFSVAFLLTSIHPWLLLWLNICRMQAKRRSQVVRLLPQAGSSGF